MFEEPQFGFTNLSNFVLKLLHVTSLDRRILHMEEAIEVLHHVFHCSCTYTIILCTAFVSCICIIRGSAHYCAIAPQGGGVYGGGWGVASGGIPLLSILVNLVLKTEISLKSVAPYRQEGYSPWPRPGGIPFLSILVNLVCKSEMYPKCVA